MNPTQKFFDAANKLIAEALPLLPPDLIKKQVGTEGSEESVFDSEDERAIPYCKHVVMGLIAHSDQDVRRVAVQKLEGYINATMNIDHKMLLAISHWLDTHRQFERDSKAIQTSITEIGKKFFGKEKLRDAYGIIYLTLNGTSTGPRLGTFISLLGFDLVITKLNEGMRYNLLDTLRRYREKGK